MARGTFTSKRSSQAGNSTRSMEALAVKTKLDKDERAIERSADSYRKVSKSELRKIEGVLDRIRKTRNVNIRISEMVLEELKKRSQEEGIPYQTLISSVL